MFPSDTSDVKGDDTSSSDDSTTLPLPGHAEPHGQRHSSLQQSQSQLDSASASASQPSPPSAELSLGTGGGGGGSGGAATVALAAQASGPGRPRKRYVGVRQRPSGRWVAEIKDTTHKIRLWLGTFNNPEDAARAYDDAARTLRGANTRTNFARTAGSRSGFSSNSVRLLLQRAVEAAAVAGTLDSGGLLPSAAAAAAAAAAGSGSTSGSEQVPSGLGYDRSVAAALSDSSELEEQVQERGDVSSDYSELDPLFAAHARSRHRGETSHSSTVMSLAQQASSVHGLPPTVVAPGSQLRAYSGLAPLDQRQVLKAGLGSGYSSAAYVESDSQLVEGGKPDQGGSKNYHASHVLDIYESLREKLGCRAGASTDQSPSTMQQLPPNGSTGPSFNPGLGEGRGTMAGDMGRGSWEQTPSDRDLSQWSRTRMHEMQDHMPPVSAAQSIEGSWDRNQAEDGSCDLEELGITSVNPWGDVGSRILAHDHDREEDAERMEGIASLNWDDLGQAAEQTRRPIELGMSTMKWSRNADGPQGMEGIESWGSMHMEGGDLGGPEAAHVSAAHAPTISRSSWTPNTGSGHDQLQIHNQWLSSGPGAPLQMLDPGHSQGSSDHGQIHSTGRGDRELHNSAHDLNPLLQHQSVSGNRSSYDYLWASSAMASPPLYVPSAFLRHIARAPFPYAAPEAGVVMENSGRQESAYRGMTTQDSNPGSGGSSNAAASAVDYMRLMSVADPNDPGQHQRRTSIFPPNESEHGTDGELNFLLSSPGFFPMDSFPRHEVQSPSFSAPDPTATRDTALNLFRASQAGATTVQVDSAFSAASLEAQRPPPVAQASDKALQMQNHLKELSNMPMARHTVSPDPAGADPIVRPSLQRTNAACLVEIVEDAGLDKEAARTR